MLPRCFVAQLPSSKRHAISSNETLPRATMRQHVLQPCGSNRMGSRGRGETQRRGAKYNTATRCRGAGHGDQKPSCLRGLRQTHEGRPPRPAVSSETYESRLVAGRKGYIRGITTVRTVAATTADTVPARKSVQVFGRMAPRATITKSNGKPRKCVKVGRCSRSARCRSREGGARRGPQAHRRRRRSAG
jgi:hypothetical protein